MSSFPKERRSSVRSVSVFTRKVDLFDIMYVYVYALYFVLLGLLIKIYSFLLDNCTLM
jgi:hypothetical protein